MTRRSLALVLAAAGALAAVPAIAQGPRAWAGSDAPVAAGREPLRVAAADAAGAEQSPSPAPRPAAGDTLIPTGNLLATIRDGGILMVPLLGCSFALAVFGIERLVSLRTGRVVPRLFASRFIEQLQSRQLTRGEALDACEENGSPAAKVFAAGVRRWGRP
ncbi:MAG: MotA/TolQ/ExbB proton channel family protein, partial [Planctomycetia bacterium]